jgi:trk system potassium uptake protein TrkA
MTEQQKPANFAVLGLGRFGFSVVETLAQYDVNILACDKDETRLNAVSSYATHILQADISNEITLQSLPLGNFDVVILGMSSEFEASLMATMVAKEQGAKKVLVKARSNRQKKILQSVGADEVIIPEYETGAKIARRLLSSNILDVLEESEFYTISEMRPMEDWLGKSIRQADIRRQHDLMILAIRRGGKLELPVSPDHVLAEEDVLITISERKKQ